MVRILFVLGTRPEAIKLLPVLRHVRTRPAEFEAKLCVTGQHRAMLDQVLRVFEAIPDFDLNLMMPHQTLSQVLARTVAGLEGILDEEKPDMVVVQGDTTTTLAGALAAFYQRIAVAHVEAGLRTGDLGQPFPEEMNRVVTGRLAELHFAPTVGAARNLMAEGVEQRRIRVTGNPGIDAVLYARDKLASGEASASEWPWLDGGKRLVLVTAHRRESFGSGMARICEALEKLAGRNDIQIVFPVHRNPNVMEPVYQRLEPLGNIVLLAPLPYLDFVDLMRRADVLLTDSGGIQEEGPSLGKPVLVMRERTERPEAVEAGTVRLVGTDAGRIVSAVEELLENPQERERMSRIHNPYGDGRASERIAAGILEYRATSLP